MTNLNLSAPTAASHDPTEAAVVSVFDDRTAAESAVDALHLANFEADRVGFALRGHDVVEGGMLTDAVGAKDARGAAAGAMTGGVVGGVVAATAALMIPGAGPLIASGVLASFFGGALAGTAVGGILGALTGLGVSETEAEFYDQQLKSGRAIVAVKAGVRANEARDILSRCGGRQIHTEATSPVPTEGIFSTP